MMTNKQLTLYGLAVQTPRVASENRNPQAYVYIIHLIPVHGVIPFGPNVKILFGLSRFNHVT